MDYQSLQHAAQAKRAKKTKGQELLAPGPLLLPFCSLLRWLTVRTAGGTQMS